MKRDIYDLPDSLYEFAQFKIKESTRIIEWGEFKRLHNKNKGKTHETKLYI